MKYWGIFGEGYHRGSSSKPCCCSVSSVSLYLPRTRPMTRVMTLISVTVHFSSRQLQQVFKKKHHLSLEGIFYPESSSTGSFLNPFRQSMKFVIQSSPPLMFTFVIFGFPQETLWFGGFSVSRQQPVRRVSNQNHFCSVALTE